jgi:hypothetical protein
MEKGAPNLPMRGPAMGKSPMVLLFSNLVFSFRVNCRKGSEPGPEVKGEDPQNIFTKKSHSQRFSGDKF